MKTSSRVPLRVGSFEQLESRSLLHGGPGHDLFAGRDHAAPMERQPPALGSVEMRRGGGPDGFYRGPRGSDFVVHNIPGNLNPAPPSLPSNRLPPPMVAAPSFSQPLTGAIREATNPLPLPRSTSSTSPVSSPNRPASVLILPESLSVLGGLWLGRVKSDLRAAEEAPDHNWQANRPHHDSLQTDDAKSAPRQETPWLQRSLQTAEEETDELIELDPAGELVGGKRKLHRTTSAPKLAANHQPSARLTAQLARTSELFSAHKWLIHPAAAEVVPPVDDELIELLASGEGAATSRDGKTVRPFAQPGAAPQLQANLGYYQAADIAIDLRPELSEPALPATVAATALPAPSTQ